jgi:hypothetical protein
MPKLPLILAALVTSGLTFTTVNAGGFFSSRQDSRGFELESFVAHKSTHQRTYQITGVITDEGVECTALRGTDGRLYTFAGNSGNFQPGDRVRVIGRVAQASFCMQGTTLEVRRIIALR